MIHTVLSFFFSETNSLFLLGRLWLKIIRKMFSKIIGEILLVHSSYNFLIQFFYNFERSDLLFSYLITTLSFARARSRSCVLSVASGIAERGRPRASSGLRLLNHNLFAVLHVHALLGLDNLATAEVVIIINCEL